MFLIILLSISGCATTSTLNQADHKGKPLVFSGTRLDIAALRDEPNLKKRFGVSAPKYPLLDLPFSGFLDIFVLGYTVPVALFFGR